MCGECTRTHRHWQLRASVRHVCADAAGAQWQVFGQAQNNDVGFIRGSVAGVCFDDMSSLGSGVAIDLYR